MLKNLKMYKKVIIIGFPIVLENLVYNFINFIDNFMVGQENPSLNLGKNALAAIGISNQIFFLYSVAMFGLFSGAGVLSAQYYGSKNIKSMNKIMGFLLISSSILSLPFLIFGIFYPKFLFLNYTKDLKTIFLAIEYFKIACLTFPLVGIGFAFSMQLRVIGKSKYSFYASFIALIINGIGNYILIPILGVKGAAISTLIARIFSLIYIVVIIYYLKLPIIGKFKNMFELKFDMIKKILSVSLPAFSHELLWVLGVTLKTMIYSNIGAFEYAAIVTTNTISSSMYSVVTGISSASSVLVGNELGAGNKQKALNISKFCIRFTAFMSIVLGILLNIFSRYILTFMGMESLLKELTLKIIFIESLLFISKCLVGLLVIGILRAGGDIFYSMMLDLVGVWFISIPFALLARYMNLPITYIFLLGSISDAVVLLPLFIRYRQGKWLKKIV